MKINQWSSILVLSAALWQAPVAHASFWGGNNQMENNAAQMDKSLNLTIAQKLKIKVIREEAKAALMPKYETMRDLHKQINQAIATDPVDQAKIDQLVDQQTALIGAAMHIKVKAKEDIYQLLNPGQRAKFQELMNKWDEKYQHLEN